MGDKKFIYKNLEEKYTTSLEFYNVKIINDIMYNEKVQVVWVFKDFLIYDDLTEFLKRSYTYPEAIIRLSKIYEFYDAYSQVFPNYIRLSPRKLMYKNIERKQRLIEHQNDSSDTSSSMLDETSSRIGAGHKSNSKMGLVNQNIFNSQFIQSVLKSNKKKYDVMNIEDVLDSFVRHSVSHNNISSFLNESNYSIFSKTNTKNVTPQKSAVDLLAQEHKNLHTSIMKKKARNSIEPNQMVAGKSLGKKLGYKPYYDRKKPDPKMVSKQPVTYKKPMVNNYVPKRVRDKIKVEIGLPLKTEENQLKYSLLTNSSDGQKIIYLKRKDGSREDSKENSKDRDKEHDEPIHKFEDVTITAKNVTKKAPAKNAKAYLTSSFPKTLKSESQKSTNSGTEEGGTLQRFGSASSKGEKILEIETLKSRVKKSNPKKCKKKSNLVNYMGKNHAAKMKLQMNKDGDYRPHTVQDYVIKPPSCSSKKSDKSVKPRLTDSGSRFIKSSKGRQTSDLVNLINQTKKDVENLRAFRRNSKNGGKVSTKKNNYVSPLGDRSKDDAYGLNDPNKKCFSSNKSDKSKLKRKRIVNGSNSSRKNKVKSKQTNYQPSSGTINLISRNDMWVTTHSGNNKKGKVKRYQVDIASLNSRKQSHKRTNSIGTSERSDNKEQSKNRFLVSKKYNKHMVPIQTQLSIDTMKSWLTKSLKFGNSLSISKNNNTNIHDVYTPTAKTTKVNFKQHMLAKKCLGIAKKQIDSDFRMKKPKRKRKVNDFKVIKQSNIPSPVNKIPTAGYHSAGSGIRTTLKPTSLHSVSTSKRIESQIGSKLGHILHR